MKKLGCLFTLILLLCGSTNQDDPISYTIKVTSAVVGEEAKVAVQTRDLEEDTAATEHMTPFEISAETGTFSGVITRLSGAAEIQVDVYCEGCKESPILYGHGTQVSMKLDGALRTFSVQKCEAPVE